DAEPVTFTLNVERIDPVIVQDRVTAAGTPSATSEVTLADVAPRVLAGASPPKVLNDEQLAQLGTRYMRVRLQGPEGQEFPTALTDSGDISAISTIDEAVDSSLPVPTGDLREGLVFDVPASRFVGPGAHHWTTYVVSESRWVMDAM